MSRASEGRTACAAPSVSVIIPIYNVEKYLRKCLDSILGQTLGAERMEVICVDDGSTDASLAILNEYAARHANLIVEKQENSGPSIARNRGLKIAKGDYILFMDSDDWLTRPDALEKLHARAVEMRLDELIFCGDVAYDDADPSELFVSRSRRFKAEYDYSLVESGQETYVRLVANDDYPVVVWRRLYRREFLLENELWFIPDIVHQDQIYTRECAALAERVNCWDFVCHCYLVRGDSISAGKKKFPFKSIYARLVGLMRWEEFARAHLSGARADFIAACRTFEQQWSDSNARQYLELPRKQRSEFWETVPEEQRGELRERMSTAIANLRARRLKRFLLHPVQRLRSVLHRRLG